MKVRLVNSEIKENYSANLLRERGIDDLFNFLNPTHDNIQEWSYLDNMLEGAELIKAINSGKHNIGLVVDCDVDGYTSSAIIYQYLMRLNPELDIHYYIHGGKAHGLEEHYEEMIAEGFELVIVPDAGSNDDKYAKLFDCPVLVIDHHIIEEKTEEAENMIIINNQSSPDYDNKHLSGAGMVYQFCKALDYYEHHNYAEDYIDLAALGICADMMSGLETENQAFWKYGFSNINNYFFKTLVDKQSYSMGGKINPIGVAFYVVPLINAMVRSGTQEEKERMFLAFIDGESMVVSKKRGAKGALEKVAIESARECTNAKTRQNKLKDSITEKLEVKIFKHDLLENQILFIRLDDDDDFPSELNGLVAMQLSAKYKRPTIVARINEEGEIKGSARGVNNSELESFKNYLESTGLVTFTAGHDNAHGVGIMNYNLDKLHEKANQELLKYNFGEDCYEVNFVRYGSSADLVKLVEDIAKYENIWSQDCSEPRIYIKDITVSNSDIQIMGTNKDTLKFTKNGITYIKFHAKDLISEIQALNSIHFDIVGRGQLNSWMGKTNPQILIEACEVSDASLMF